VLTGTVSRSSRNKTISRSLSASPHITQTSRKKGKYLFNQKALATVFIARFLAGLNEAGFSIPVQVPHKWVVDCTRVGKGITALKYLSKYLYRGVISENNIVSNQNGQVSFRYIESRTGETKYRIAILYLSFKKRNFLI